MKGGALISHNEIEAVKGCGLRGDRWYRSNDPLTTAARAARAFVRGRSLEVTSISIISTSMLALGNANLAQLTNNDPEAFFTPLEMRRNVLLDGDDDLNSLVGQKFWIGNIEFLGTMRCTPCKLPPTRAGKLVGREQLFKEAFAECGGLRAQILNSGMLRIGDRFRWTEQEEPALPYAPVPLPA